MSVRDGRFVMEASQIAFAIEKLTNAGDNKTFDATVTKISNKSGYEPSVIINGILNGFEVNPSATSDQVEVSSGSAHLNGVKNVSVTGASLTITRAPTLTHMVNSITVDASGSLVVIAGTEGSSFNEGRGAAGSAPYIPLDSIEIGQVRVSSTSSAAIQTNEIFTANKLYREVVESNFKIDYMQGKIELATSLPTIHTGDETKAIHMGGYEPELIDVDGITSFSAPEIEASTNSTAVIGGQKTSVSETLGTGSLDVILEDGVTEAIVAEKNNFLHFALYPNKSSLNRIEGQAKLTISRSWSADGDTTASCTLSPSQEWIEVKE